MENCIFCKIIQGEIDSAKIWEDEEFIAILDINPNTKGMALVLTKDHYDSYVFEMPDDIYSKFLIAAKKVAKMLEKGLEVKRIAMVMEGMGVNHAHIKLYPMYDSREGYITTQLGPRAELEELKKIAEEIKKNNLRKSHE
jgi:histidine triad (HIT) family protein